MGDPEGALTHVLNAINKEEGVCMIVENYMLKINLKII